MTQAATKATFILIRTGNGWQCKMFRGRVIGWGSRPELAIRDYRLQSKLQREK